ncbi:MAG: hypothetical protein ACREJD_14175 [Phycisphaerales bacterium]
MTNAQNQESSGAGIGVTGRSPLVSAASLPPDLRRIIDQVLKKSRLWPSERADIEAELASHFADGLDSGASSQQLATDFGDPAAAAQLIRRSRLRNRPGSWHALRLARRFVVGAVGFVFLSYSILSIRYYVGRPTITWDFRKEINAPALAIPQDQRAWPAMKRAFAAIENPKREKETDEAGTRLPPLSPYDTPEGARVNQRAIALMRAAVAFSRLGLIVDDSDDYVFFSRQSARLNGEKDWETKIIDVPSRDGQSGISILLPQLGPLRQFARLLVQDVDLAIAKRDSQAVGEDLVATMRLAVLNRETPFIITDLVSIAMGELAMGKLQELLTKAPELVSDKALEQFAAALTAMGPRQQLIRFDTELRVFEDVLQRSFTDDGNGDGRLTPAGVQMLLQLLQFGNENQRPSPAELAVSPVSSTLGPGRKQLRGLYASMVHEVKDWQKSPRWARTAPPEPEVAKLGTQSISPYSFVNLFMPAFNNSVYAADQFEASRDATLTTIAIERFKRSRRNFPASLSELVPDFLPAVPLDFADGQPLRYKTSVNAYTLYSIGVNLRDDGGTPPSKDEGESTAFDFRPQNLDLAKIHNDWVFHPRIPERMLSAPN